MAKDDLFIYSLIQFWLFKNKESDASFSIEKFVYGLETMVMVMVIFTF